MNTTMNKTSQSNLLAAALTCALVFTTTATLFAQDEDADKAAAAELAKKL